MIKNKIIKFFLYIIFFTLPFPSFSQYIDLTSLTAQRSQFLETKREINGSPFISQNFEPVWIKGETSLFMARFNAHNGRMEIEMEESKVVVLEPYFNWEVRFTRNNKTYETFFYEDYNGFARRGFLVVAHEDGDKLKLLKEEKIRYFPRVLPKSHYHRDVPARYVREPDQFYLNLGDQIFKLPTKKRQLLKIFPEQSKKIGKFIKNNKISLSNEQDLKTLSSYIASLDLINQ